MSSELGCTIWLTGLPCSGKSTIARFLAERILEQGRLVEVLDGDVVRQGLSRGLGFTPEDRESNVRRVGFVANLLSRNGVVVIVALVSPYQATRAEVRAQISRFFEVHVDCSLSECERRDVKGMYKKARAGALQHFTGIDDPYERPVQPDITLHTDLETVEESANRVLGALRQLGYAPESRAPLGSTLSAHQRTQELGLRRSE